MSRMPVHQLSIDSHTFFPEECFPRPLSGSLRDSGTQSSLYSLVELRKKSCFEICGKQTAEINENKNKIEQSRKSILSVKFGFLSIASTDQGRRD